MINTQLYEGKTIRLTAIDPDTDAVFESEWSHDPHYAPYRREKPIHPIPIFAVKKEMEKQQKKSDEAGNSFHFAIRAKKDDSLVGFLRLGWISWANRVAVLRVDFPDVISVQNYGEEVISLAQIFSFRELNLFRIDFELPEYEKEMIKLLEHSAFQLEICQRENFYRDGRRWNWLYYGCLSEDWEKLEQEERL